MSEDLETLGARVRELRVGKGLTQARLGELAGYGAGAGVSISKVESGRLMPRPAKIALIAEALDVQIADLWDARGAHEDARSTDTNRLPPRAVKARLERVQAERAARREAVESSLRAFERARDGADEFLDGFLQSALLLEDAPALNERPRGGPTVSVSANGSAESGSSVPVVTPVAIGQIIAGGASLLRPWLGGVRSPSAPKESALLVALAAGSVGGLGAGVVLAYFATNAQRQREQQAVLEEAERELATSEPATEALAGVLASATSTLKYIALYGTHALRRWQRAIWGTVEPGQVQWSTLDAEAQQRFFDFIEVAAAQTDILAIELQSIADARDPLVVEDKEGRALARIDAATRSIEKHF